MRPTALIVIACAIIMRARSRSTLAVRHLSRRWKLVFVVIAAVLAVLVLFNPEFLVIDLLGDAAFFDLFVLAVTLQMYLFTAATLFRVDRIICASVRWQTKPTTPMSCMVVLSMFAIGAMVKAVQQAARPIRLPI